MENENFKYFDSYNISREVKINKDSDFTFVQKDKSIHDLKLQGKATTFFKDSLKRFFKNTSSVTGGIILGLLILLAIFVPIVMPSNGAYNVDTTQIMEAELSPKLFSHTNGFWDGTIRRNGYAYNKETGLPAGFRAKVATNVVTYDVVENKATEYGEGGKVLISNAPYSGNTSDYLGIKSYALDLDFKNTYTLTLNFTVEDVPGFTNTDYRVLLVNSDYTTSYFISGNSDSGYVSLPDSTKVTINLGDSLKKYNSSFNLDSLSGYSIFVGVKPSTTLNTAILLDSLAFTSSDTTDNETVSQISFADGNTMMLQNAQIIKTIPSTVEGEDPTEVTVDNLGYWANNLSAKSAYQVTCNYCNFDYNKYEEVYGDIEKDISSAYISLRIKYGYMSFDFSNWVDNPSKEEIASRFKILDDTKCSIREIYTITGTPVVSKNSDGSFKRVSGINCTGVCSQYREMGYESMPIFIFGTNGKGQDFFKKIFTGLRLSLLIAFGVSIINIAIGLVWGSVSGYFGGWTDIVMERITDIIGGLPTMVIITLCILYAHNDVLAMLIALFMTGWMGVAGRTRTQFYRFKGMEYVLASRTLGAKDSRLIFRHILPNSLGTIITSSILMIPGVMYTEASIAYLGLGLKDVPLFGVILSEGNAYFQSEATFLLVIPTIIMMLLMIAFNLFGNGLRDAFNPSLKGSE